MGALINYCKTDYDSHCIVSRNPKCIEAASNILVDNMLDKDSIRLVSLADLPKDFKEPTLLIVFEASLKEALETSKQLNYLKDKGVPVVFGNARDIFFQYPNVTEQGITYAGMFQLCHNYLNGIKKLDTKRLAYAEFGVFDGRTCTLAWQIFGHQLGHFYAFDSFRGILGKAEGEERFYETGDYYANKETFLLNLSMVGASSSDLTVVECDFDSDLKDSSIGGAIQHKYGVVHIDCDVYPAAYNVLNFVTPHLADGAILLFDDYDSMWGDVDKGEKFALAKWSSENPNFIVSEYRRYSATGRAFLCYKKSVS